mgnify:CR=1 FL=1
MDAFEYHSFYKTNTFTKKLTLFNDNKTKAQNVTRDFVIKTNSQNRKAPLINVFGGKITTYRILAEKVMNELKPYWLNETDYVRNFISKTNNFSIKIPKKYNGCINSDFK